MIAAALFVLDGVGSLVLAVAGGMTASIGGVVVARIIFLVPMIGGFKAFRIMDEQERQSSGSAPGVAPSSLSQPAAIATTPLAATSEPPGEARRFSIARVLLISLASLLISFVPFPIAAMLSANGLLSDRHALLVSVVPIIAAGIWCIAVMLRFAWLRGIDLCPACGKPFSYHRNDAGRLLRCRRCRHAWTAGAEQV